MFVIFFKNLVLRYFSNKVIVNPRNFEIREKLNRSIAFSTCGIAWQSKANSKDNHQNKDF